MELGFEKIEQKFSSPQEELNYLRAEVAKHEKNLLEKGEIVPQEEIITDKLIDYKNTKPEETIKTRLSVSLFFLGILFKD